MNIDELKMILETINTTTGLAKDMGTTWIWLHYGFKVLDVLACIACFESPLIRRLCRKTMIIRKISNFILFSILFFIKKMTVLKFKFKIFLIIFSLYENIF